MTIQSVDLTQEGCDLSGEGMAEEFLKRTYTSHYRVTTDDPETNPRDVERHFRNTNSLPYYGRIWRWSNGRNDPNSICKKLKVSHQPLSLGVFTVECVFEPIDSRDNQQRPNNDDGEDSEDPLEWREQVSFSYTQMTVPVMKAIFRGFTTGENGDEKTRGINALQEGKWYVPQASNLIPYDPLPEYEIDLKIIRLVKNVDRFDSNLYDPFISTVNDRPIWIIKRQLGMFCTIDPLLGRVKGINATSDFQNGKGFVRREIEIWVNPNGWRLRLADMGMVAKPRDDQDDGFVSPGELENKPKQAEQLVIRDADDFPIGQPVLLDGFGRPLRSSNATRNVWTNWQVYDERDWLGLDL